MSRASSNVTGAGIEIEFPQSDIDSVFKAMAAGQRELGWTLAHGVKKVAWAISSSLGTSARIAPKYRKFYADLEDQRRIQEDKLHNKNMRSAGYLSVKGKDQLFVAKGKTGKKLYFRARSEAQAKKHPFVIIKNRGMAKASFSWGMKWLGRQGSMAGVGKGGKFYGSKYIRVQSDLKGANPQVKITNRVSYILDALRGGPQAVDTAMERAASSLMHEIENTLRKKLGMGRE